MRILTPCLIILGTLAWPSLGLAGDIGFNNGAWTTSFDYGQECSLGGNPSGSRPDCDVIKTDGINWCCGSLSQGGHYSESVVAANNSKGGGGQGSRFWSNDGTNKLTTKATINFANVESEFWIRWYQRYEAGYSWANGNPAYDKNFYMWENGPGGNSILAQHGSGGFHIASGGVGFTALPSAPFITWADVNGHPSNGLFHMYEVHVKMNTGGLNNGIAQMWIDGVRVINRSNANFNGLTGISRMDFHSNQATPANSGPKYVDYDDIAIYKTLPPNLSPDGDPWIGPLNGFSGAGSLPRPKPPAPVGVSFYNPIEDNNLTSRDWYDKTSMVLANSGATSGSAKSIEYRFNSGATQAVR